jgi:tRNA G18 (ribose-2'-O)-methylase SpoU
MPALPQRGGFQLVALTLRPDAVDLETWAAGRSGERVALLLGTEGAGLRRRERSACGCLRQDSDSPGVDSLNVSVAAGIALYRCLQQQR